MRRLINMAGIFLALAGSLSAQDIDPRIEALDARGKYGEALAWCLRQTDPSPATQYFVGDYIYHGRKGVARDVEKGKELYLKALDGLLPLAEEGDAAAQYRAARCLEFGKADMAAANKWYSRAAEGGNAKAMCRNAVLELMSGNLSGEFPEYFKRAAELGEPDAKAWQGAMLIERKETQEQGVALLREAANGGSAVAMARLAALSYLGEGGVEQNVELALRQIQAAVDRGYSEGIEPLEMIREKHERMAREAQSEAKRARAPAVRPGDGFPGRLEKYDVTPQLKTHLERFNLTAGWFRREHVGAELLKEREAEQLIANELPYLLFTPKRGSQPVPVLVYFGGIGEHGTNLVDQFKQSVIFSKVTSPEFQKEHPCYLFAPMVPKGANIRCMNGWSPPMADLVCDAMYAVMREAKNPPVDANRIYLTGLSFGGSAAYTFPFGYPGRFAASLPVAGTANSNSVPKAWNGNIWLLYNEHEYASPTMRQILADMADVITERGGEFRSSSFPDAGHDSWSKAWREDAVWEWLFSKTADGNPISQSAKAATPVAQPKRAAMFLEGASCTASKPGRDAGTGPERAADGLEATCYVSAEPFKRGDWWQMEFAEPVSGRIIAKSGNRDGSGRVASAMFVETSVDGESWTRGGRFSRASGECRFEQRSPVKYLRVISESPSGEILVLREVEVASD
jgi:Predicted peptidase